MKTESGLNFGEAEQRCRDLRGELVDVTSEQKRDIVQWLVNENYEGDVWVSRPRPQNLQLSDRSWGSSDMRNLKIPGNGICHMMNHDGALITKQW